MYPHAFEAFVRVSQIKCMDLFIGTLTKIHSKHSDKLLISKFLKNVKRYTHILSLFYLSQDLPHLKQQYQ